MKAEPACIVNFARTSRRAGKIQLKRDSTFQHLPLASNGTVILGRSVILGKSAGHTRANTTARSHPAPPRNTPVMRQS